MVEILRLLLVLGFIAAGLVAQTEFLPWGKTTSCERLAAIEGEPRAACASERLVASGSAETPLPSVALLRHD